MSKNETTRVIEINGVKFEVDLRQAVRIEVLKVGQRVRVLTKQYDGYKVSHGVVIGFEPFEKLPTVLVAYVEIGHASCEIKHIAYNAATKDVEIVASIDSERLDKETAEANLEKQVAKAEKDVQDAKDRLAYFRHTFSQCWEPHVEKASA